MHTIAKKRTIRTQEQIPEQAALVLEGALRALPGVRRLHVSEAGRIVVEYDLGKVQLETIESAIEAAGVMLKRSLLTRVYRSIIHDLERNEYDNATAPKPPCCSNPRL